VNYNTGGGKQRTYLMLAMETLVKEDWPAAFSFSFVSSCSFGFLCLFSGSLGLSP